MSIAIRESPGCTPLESGDRLNREEFERRYADRPDIKKAELVEGVVYVASPVKISQHGRPHSFMNFWLTAYVARHPEFDVADNGTVRLDGQNEPQPDVMLFRSREGRIDSDDYLAGAPELVVEIAASSASYDLGPKMEAYRRNGVREYIVWQILEERIDWFQLIDGEYAVVAPTDGIIESSEFPGLRLNVAAMLAGDLAAVQAALAQA